MNVVEAGQKWSLLNMGRYGGGRMEVVIDAVEGDAVHGTTVRGRKLKLRLVVLQRGLRGARRLA